jgi:hypothetical protein
MSVKTRERGSYELFETDHRHEILVLNGRRWFAVVRGGAFKRNRAIMEPRGELAEIQSERARGPFEEVATAPQRDGAHSSGSQPLVLPENRPQPIVVDGIHPVTLETHHRFACHQGVDDRLLGGKHCRAEEAADPIVGKHLHRHHGAILGPGALVGRGEGDHDIAGAVAGGAAGARDAQGRPLGQPFELVRQARGVGGQHDDDGAPLVVVIGSPRKGALSRSSRPTGVPATCSW